MAFGFGSLPQQPTSLADLARLFDPAMFGLPQGFSGTSGQIVPPPQLQGAQPQSMPAPAASMFQPSPAMPPQAAPAPDLQAGGPVAGDFTPPAMPAPQPTADAPRPSGFGFGPLPQAAATPAPAPETTGSLPPSASPPVNGGPSIMDGLGRGFRSMADDGLFTSIGLGLLSSPTWAGGIAARLQHHEGTKQKRAISDLARAEMGLKTSKLAAEFQKDRLGQSEMIALLERKGYSAEDARSMVAAAGAGNSTALQNALGNAVPKNPDAPSGYRPNADGSLTAILGGPQDPTTLRTQTQARAEDYNLGPDTARIEAGTGRVIAQTGPKRPEGFESEAKLRGEFSRGLGTFGEVHDGYGRVIAATEQRAKKPDGVSPASDISLVFGFMKMLDPGSVVREGEYATAQNAAGIPDRVRNAYNKALQGEFLAPEQRQDFVDTAGRLYGQARGTAEGVQSRYRDLASQYGVDPGRTAYLPPALAAPQVGPSRTTGAPGPDAPAPRSSKPAGSAQARFQNLMRSGLSKEQAYEKMRAEGF